MAEELSTVDRIRVLEAKVNEMERAMDIILNSIDKQSQIISTSFKKLAGTVNAVLDLIDQIKGVSTTDHAPSE